MSPAISVLIPAYEAAGVLARALLSVARQTVVDWECVVVDDGSRDGTGDVVRAFARRDPRFRLVAAPHRGIVGALAAGLERCRGEAIARMDADDLMAPDRLAAQAAALAGAPALAAVGSHVRLFPRARLRPGRLAYEAFLDSMRTEADVRANAFVECPVAHPSLFVRAATLRAFGYRDRGWPEDYDLVLRMLAGGARIGVVPRALLRWRDRPGRLSRTHPAYALERFVECKAEFLAQGPLAGGDRYVLWGYGDTGKALRRALARHAKTPAVIVELHPGRLGQRMDGVAVVPPAGLRDWHGLPLLASVAGAEARGQIRAALAAMGWVEGRDFWCTA